MEKKLPLYHQLADKISSKIENNEYKVEEKIPTERTLCETYQVSRATVRQALAYLEKNGYIYKIQGRGTFVAPKVVEQSLLKFYSFSEEMKKNGREPRAEVVAFKIVKATESVYRTMNIESDSELYELRRVMFADNKPMMYEKTFLLAKRFPELKRSMLEKRSMYDLLTKLYNVSFERAEETFQPIKLSEQEAAYLHTDTDEPSMKIERVTFEKDKAIEYSISVTRNKFKYKITLQK